MWASRLSLFCSFVLITVASTISAQALNWRESATRVLEEAAFAEVQITVIGNEEAAVEALTWPQATLSEEETSFDRFRAGSISKLLTSLLVLRAAEANFLRLDDSVEDWLPGVFAETAFPTDRVTIAHLLEHTAGLPGSDYAEYAMQAPGLSPTEYVQTRQPFRLRWPPGQHHSYANSGHTIAAAVVETAWDAPFDALMQREVLEPLGMMATSFENTSDVPGLLPSFSASGEVIKTTWAMPMRPAGAMVTTAVDLAKVVTMLLREGRLPDGQTFLDPAQVTRMEQGQLSLAGEAGALTGTYGLGNFNFLAGENLWRGHWGRTEGFQANLGYNQAVGKGFVILTNSADRRAMFALREALTKALIPEPNQPTWTAQPLENLPSTEGFFVNHSHDMPFRGWLFGLLQAVQLQAQHDQLTVLPVTPVGGAVNTFVHLGDGLFVAENLGVPTATLAEVDGEVFWVDGESYRRVPAWQFWSAWISLLSGLFAALLTVVVLVVREAWGFLPRKAGVTEKMRVRKRAWRWLGIGAVAHWLLWILFVQYGLLSGTAGATALGKVTFVSLILCVVSLVAPLSIVRALLFRPGGWAVTLLSVGLLLGIGLQAINGWLPFISW